MITSRQFRDHYVLAISIRYERDTSYANVRLSVQDAQGVTCVYEIGGVTEYYVDEDLQSLAIAQCTLINEPDNVYLSLDPFNEGAPSEKDNFCFKGASIELRQGL